MAFTISVIEKLLEVMSVLPGLTIGIERVKCSVSSRHTDRMEVKALFEMEPVLTALHYFFLR